MSVFQYLLDVKSKKGAGFLVLFDPGHVDEDTVGQIAADYQDSGADAFLVGSSILLSDNFSRTIRRIKQSSDLPVIIFPNGVGQLSADADAILFMSMISGRNPELLIGQQAKAAPIVKDTGLEAISTGYMIVESGRTTSVEYMSGTKPIPRDKPEIAMAHALAAEYLGMKCVYLDAGSGAAMPISDKMLKSVVEYISLPLIAGGGIREPDTARGKVKSGASFVVVGSALEKDTGGHLTEEFADAIHIKE